MSETSTRSARSPRSAGAFPVLATLVFVGGGAAGLLGLCGPFTDVTDPTFCSNVLEIYYLGVTTGTTATTYAPGDPVTRLQMAIFLSREADHLLLRGSRRAALRQLWAPLNSAAIGLTTVGTSPQSVRSDGVDLWVSGSFSGSVERVRAGDGKLLQSWTGATNAESVLVAAGYVFVTGYVSPGRLYRIDPAQSAGSVTTVASNLGGNPTSAAFDGGRIWTANHVFQGSVSIVTPGASLPWTVTTVGGAFTSPLAVLYDGANIWLTDQEAGTLLKLDANGAILQTVTVGSFPNYPVFDGTNIWVPNGSANSVSVVRASSGAVLATLTGNGLADPQAAAFDGQRVLVTSDGAGGLVSLWSAAGLVPLGSALVGPGTSPINVCSDGVNFWIVLAGTNQLARF